MAMNNLAWLQQWYLSNCNGDWKHGLGISIDTLDNPGWSVKISLIGTYAENIRTPGLKREADDSDWVHCSISEKEFSGYGGPGNLEEILHIFRTLVEEAEK